MGNPLNTLCNEVSKMVVGSIDTSQPLDEEKVAWYKSRFDMFEEDGVPGAIGKYIEKLMKENVNEHTLAFILYDATSRLRDDK